MCFFGAGLDGLTELLVEQTSLPDRVEVYLADASSRLCLPLMFAVNFRQCLRFPSKNMD